ncbi:hypothetical protein J4440_05455 [Candidatus Woesearchaeota archaeon]|nr:hypothetical protein [Candidatus Woesearchaeota archaeon]
MTIVLIFGDSVVQGFWDYEGGWADRLKQFLMSKSLENEKYFFSVFNLGISGDTSKDILERIEFETRQRIKLLEKDEDIIFLISIGSNDSIYNLKTKKHYIDLKEFENNLTKIFIIAKKYSDKIIFVGDNPVDEDLTNPIPWLKDCSYNNNFIQKYSKVSEELCKKDKLYFIEIYNKFSKMKYKELLSDGVHSNSEGHKMIFEIVKDFLVKNKLI